MAGMASSVWRYHWCSHISTAWCRCVILPSFKFTKIQEARFGISELKVLSAHTLRLDQCETFFTCNFLAGRAGSLPRCLKQWGTRKELCVCARPDCFSVCRRSEKLLRSLLFLGVKEEASKIPVQVLVLVCVTICTLKWFKVALRKTFPCLKVHVHRLLHAPDDTKRVFFPLFFNLKELNKT